MQLLSSRVNFQEFLLQFPEEGSQRIKMAYRSFAHCENHSFLRRIHGATLSHFASSLCYNKQQQFVCEFPLDVHHLLSEIKRRNAPRIWWDFDSALPI
jgi:hypothetical protein